MTVNFQFNENDRQRFDRLRDLANSVQALADTTSPIALAAATVPTLTYDASTPDGTGTDNSAALQAAANAGPASVALPGFYNPANSSTGGILFATAITIPTKQNWQGFGGKTKFVIPAADPCPGGYLLFGANSSYQSAQSYDLFGRKEIGAFMFDGRAAAANGKSPVGVVVGMPTATVRDIYCYGMQTAVRGADAGGTGNDPHADHLVITNVHTNYQPSPVDFDWLNPGNARYAIDYLRTNVGADGALIERCQANATGNVPNQKRARHIGVRSWTNGVVRRVLNGDVYFYQSKTVLEDSYFEHGQTTVLDSEVVIQRNTFYQRSEVSVGSDMGCVPLRIIAATGLESPSSAPPSFIMRDNVWMYDAVGQAAGIGLGGYSLTNYNFTLDPALYAVGQIENCWRSAPYTNERGWGQKLGLRCGMADFDNYSHFASMASRLEMSGTSGGARWRIEAKRGPLTITSSATDNCIESVSDAGNGFKVPWSAPAGTYYYKAAIYYDKIRSIGILGALEASIAKTAGGNINTASDSGVSIRLSFYAPGGGYMVRLYRGTSAGSYDKYVDIPVLMAGRLYDNGLDVGGFAWQSRTAGAADAVNASLSGGIDLMPGERTSGSDAYGKVIAYSLSASSAMPTTGGWRRGDEVRFVNPQANGSTRTTGYRRLTDCTSASPAHSLGTDWEVIAVTSPVAEGLRFADGASGTLTAGIKHLSVASNAGNVVVSMVAANEVEGFECRLEIRSWNGSNSTVTINKSSGASQVTLDVPGWWTLFYDYNNGTWKARRIGDLPLAGTLDGGSGAFEQVVASSATTVTMADWANVLNVDTTLNALAITMPSAAATYNGYTRLLIVRGYTQAITITGGSTVINQTGLYMLVKTQGAWKVTRMGAAPA